MDILVTTPKSEIDNSRREGEAVEAEGGFWFRTFKNRPKVFPGDKIFFVEDGLIRGYGLIFAIEQIEESETCDNTGRLWGRPGYWIVKYNDWHWLSQPVPFKGFQGFRYVDNIPGLREKIGA